MKYAGDGCNFRPRAGPWMATMHMSPFQHIQGQWERV